MTEEAERVARIIDPHCWWDQDKVIPVWDHKCHQGRERALAKAKKVIELLASLPEHTLLLGRVEAFVHALGDSYYMPPVVQETYDALRDLARTLTNGVDQPADEGSRNHVA